MKRLTKSRTNKKLCGVCGGIAEYLEMDATVLRILFIFVPFINLFTYFILALVIPYDDNVPPDIKG